MQRLEAGMSTCVALLERLIESQQAAGAKPRAAKRRGTATADFKTRRTAGELEMNSKTLWLEHAP